MPVAVRVASPDHQKIFRMGLCTLMHRNSLVFRVAFNLAMAQICTNTHLVFLMHAQRKIGFMHINAPRLLVVSAKCTCIFMMRYAH